MDPKPGGNGSGKMPKSCKEFLRDDSLVFSSARFKTDF